MEKPRNIKSDYRQYIRSYINQEKKHGFIGYWGSLRASGGAEELIDRAVSLARETKYSEALTIYQAIIETLVPAIQYADDSNGTIGNAINIAIEGLQTCSASITPGEKTNFFKYLVKEAVKKQYQGWDWEFDLLRIAAELTDNDRKTRVLFDLLDKTAIRKNDKGITSDFTYENAVKLKCLVLKKRGLIPDLKTLIRNNLNFTAIREIAIQDAIDMKELEEAKFLALRGIKLAGQKKLYGNKSTWLKFLLEIARKESNIEDIRKYSRLLFIDTGDMQYYEELRQHFSDSEWAVYLQELLKETPAIRYPQDIHEKIYIREENWETLLLFVQKRMDNVYYITKYHDYLVKHFPKELSEMYGLALRKAIKDARNRNEYSRVCPLIRKMEECGFKENVKDLVEWVRKTYSFRTALQDELSKIVKNRY